LDLQIAQFLDIADDRWCVLAIAKLDAAGRTKFEGLAKAALEVRAAAIRVALVAGRD